MDSVNSVTNSWDNISRILLWTPLYVDIRFCLFTYIMPCFKHCILFIFLLCIFRFFDFLIFVLLYFCIFKFFDFSNFLFYYFSIFLYFSAFWFLYFSIFVFSLLCSHLWKMKQLWPKKTLFLPILQITSKVYVFSPSFFIFQISSK